MWPKQLISGMKDRPSLRHVKVSEFNIYGVPTLSFPITYQFLTDCDIQLPTALIDIRY